MDLKRAKPKASFKGCNAYGCELRWVFLPIRWPPPFLWLTTTDQCWPGVLKLPINEVSVTEGPLCPNLGEI